MIEKTGLNIPGIGGAAGPTAGSVGKSVTAKGTGFSDLVKAASDQMLKTSHGAETQSLKAVTKEAKIVDVVTAVANAEMTLQTVVTIRDKVVQAYQDIMKMPI